MAENGQAQIAGFAKRVATGLPWVHVGVDQHGFDAVLADLGEEDLYARLSQLGQAGVMRLCLVTGSPVALQAQALGLVDSQD
jgi:hypothetical protein